jgi:nucleoid-associated protein YgaU
MTNRIRGSFAAVVLLAAIIGLPLALAGTVGDPLRSWSSLRGGQLSDTDVTAILAAVFYLAWVSFVIPAVVELVLTMHARITRRPRREVRLPLLGAQQDLARHLITAALLLLPAASATMVAAAPVPHLSAVQAAAATTPITADSGRHHPPDPNTHRTDHSAARRYVIPETGGMRSYWALAEHYLGDGTRWPEIWHLNEGRVHTNGIVADTPRRLFAGWTILLPPDPAPPSEHSDPPSPTTVRPGDIRAPAHTVTVQPGDTLSGLADADNLSWQRVWQGNRDRTEPDHEQFTDPNLIQPGWTITMPTDRSPAPSAVHNGHRITAPPPAPTPAPSTSTAHVRPPQPAVPTAPSSPAAGPASPRPLSTAGPVAPEHATSNQQHRDLPVPLLAGLAAAAAVVVLDRARRIAQRRRRVGHRPLPPPPDLLAVEAQIRLDARRAQPTIAAIGLANALTADHPIIVRTVIARTDGAVDLHLADPVPDPPAPFMEITGGWRLPAEASSFTFAVDNLDDPHPALIPIGATTDGQLLIDLTATGPVSVAGDPDAIEEYLRQVIDAVAGAPWSQRVQFHLPPRIAEQVNSPERVTIEDSISPRLPTSHPAEAPEPELAEEPGWRTSPIHLYIGWSADTDIASVVRAAADPARHVHIIINGAYPSTAMWTLDGDQLTLPHLSEPVTVTIAASDPAAATAADLIRFTASAPDVPVNDPRLPDITIDPASSPTGGGLTEASSATDEPGRLLLLGPVELTGTGRLRRSQVLNVLTFLALHPRGVDRHQLLAALWPDQTPSLQTMRNRIRESRALVDGAISDGPIWRLDATVTTDWAQFTTLAAGSNDEQRQALQLIRGRPFAGLDDADWLDLGGFRSEIEAAIVDLALSVGERDLADARYPAALAAARAGLYASRYEERLHRVAIRAAVAQNLNGLAKTLQQEMRTALDIDIEPDDQIQPETLALNRETRERRPVGSDTNPR